MVLASVPERISRQSFRTAKSTAHRICRVERNPASSIHTIFPRATGAGHYLDIDLTRLQPDSVKIILDGRLLDDQTALRNLADRLAANANWDLCDYRLEIHSSEGQRTNHTAFECPSTDFIIGNRFDSSENLLDNPCLAAIRE